MICATRQKRGWLLVGALVGLAICGGHGRAAAQAPFLQRGDDAVLFGGVYSHATTDAGRDAVGAGVGATVESWVQLEASVARVGGEHQTTYGAGVEVYPLRLAREGSFEPYFGAAWSHAAVFPERMFVGRTKVATATELDVYPLVAGLSLRLDFDPRVVGNLQLGLVHYAGERGPERPSRTGWAASLGICVRLSSRRSLVVVPVFSRALDQEVASVLFGLQFDRS